MSGLPVSISIQMSGSPSFNTAYTVVRGTFSVLTLACRSHCTLPHVTSRVNNYQHIILNAVNFGPSFTDFHQYSTPTNLAPLIQLGDAPKTTTPSNITSFFINCVVSIFPIRSTRLHHPGRAIDVIQTLPLN